MNQQTLKAYIDLIQGLLTCPRGEEWILLRQNQELVNTELVEVMEQVANHLVVEGKIKEAKYLHNWAGKLHHILTENVPTPKNNHDKTNAYIELIQTLLNSPRSSQEGILADHQELIGPELVKVMKQVASQMQVQGDQETANFLNDLATDLNRSWLQNHEFQPTLKKEEVPDPWLDSDSSPSHPSATETQPADSEVPAKKEETISSSAPTKEETIINSSASVEMEKEEEQLAQQLKMMANSLVKLEATLASRLQPPNPLWYMDILEKAEASNWILTTDEVENLIGIKPHCHHDETSYHRGNWIFIKTGKIGAQIGWRVQKETT